jgi:hypothetical protein
LGGRVGDPEAEWGVRIVEDDGSERNITPVEEATLLAQFEQAGGGYRREITVVKRRLRH